MKEGARNVALRVSGRWRLHDGTKDKRKTKRFLVRRLLPKKRVKNRGTSTTVLLFTMSIRTRVSRASRRQPKGKRKAHSAPSKTRIGTRKEAELGLPRDKSRSATRSLARTSSVSTSDSGCDESWNSKLVGIKSSRHKDGINQPSTAKSREPPKVLWGTLPESVDNCQVLQLRISRSFWPEQGTAQRHVAQQAAEASSPHTATSTLGKPEPQNRL